MMWADVQRDTWVPRSSRNDARRDQAHKAYTTTPKNRCQNRCTAQEEDVWCAVMFFCICMTNSYTRPAPCDNHIQQLLAPNIRKMFFSPKLSSRYAKTKKSVCMVVYQQNLNEPDPKE